MRTSEQWRDAISASVRQRESLISEWRENVAHRVMKPFASGSAVDRVAVPEDWSRTRQKKSALAHHLPTVTAVPQNPESAAAAPVMAEVLNFKARRECKAHVMLDECTSDVINAAGLMAAIVGIDIVTEPVEVPKIDPSQLPPELQAAALSQPQEMVTVEKPIYQCYYWRRISPGALLWPADFTGSNWDEADWLGYETWIPLTQALREYGESPERPNGLPKDFKPKEQKPLLLSEDVFPGDKPKATSDYAKAQVIFYWAARFDPEVRHPKALRRITFIDGHEQPVEDIDLPWQKYIEPEIMQPPVDPQTGQPQGEAEEIPGHYIGVTTFPIRVGTLDYISDLATPPSDSQAGRSQVKELIKSRSQMIRQRDSNIPVRGFDTNRIDEELIKKMQDGEWMGWIPVNGAGERAMWEVARANFPRENFEFQNIISGDLDRAWSLVTGQTSTRAGSPISATEANQVTSSSNVRLEYEKTRVHEFLAGGFEVLAGLIQLFADRTEYVQIVGADGAKRLEAWDRQKVAGEFVFEIVPDSGNWTDPAIRQERLLKLYNLAANDPTINRPVLTKKLIEAFGEDPGLLTQPMPEPKGEDPNVSFRFSGEDLTNPMAVAVMQKMPNPITVEDLAQAIQMIQTAVTQIQQPAPMPGEGGGEAPPPEAGAPPPVEPAETVNPILKRASDGSRLM